MIKKFLYRISGAEKEIDKITASSKKLESDYIALRAERYRDAEFRRKAMKVIEAGIADPSPTDVEARIKYVAEVALFYDDKLEPKLLQLLAQNRDMLDRIYAEVPEGFTREQYIWILLGTSNAFKLLLDWGDAMRSEHVANLKDSEN